MSQFVIPSPFALAAVPSGFRLKSLADDNDLRKMNRVLHRGFDHPGEPPEEGIEGRRKMQSGPNYRKDLAVIVEAPNGDFVSFCGMWFDPVNRFGYVEPVATDPDYRRRGLGRAAVLDGIRRCGELGANSGLRRDGQALLPVIRVQEAVHGQLLAEEAWMSPVPTDGS